MKGKGGGRGGGEGRLEGREERMKIEDAAQLCTFE